MKSIRLFFLAMTAVLVMAQAGFAALPDGPAAVQFHVDAPVAIPGDTLVLALHLAEPVDFYYSGFEVEFNAGTFSLLDVTPWGLSSSGLSVTEPVRPNRLGASVSRVAPLADPASGPFVRLRFVVQDDALPGTYVFTVPVLEVADAGGVSVPVSLPEALSVTVEEPPVIYIPSAFILASFDLNDRLTTKYSQYVNMNASVELFGAVFTGYATGFEGQAANSNGWMGGSNGSAYWQVVVSTEGFRDVTVSSRQLGSASGPRDFLLFGSVNGVDWLRLTADTIRVSSTSWNVAHLDRLPLPEVFNDRPVVTLRWVMASEARIDTGAPLSSSTGTSRIDAIEIRGFQLEPAFVEVWPGDANNDGLVNADDVLPLGMFWLHRGPRPWVVSAASGALPGLAAPTGFASRVAEQWVPPGATYADTNGDGVVDYRDLQWIGMHFGRARMARVVPVAGGDGIAEPVASVGDPVAVYGSGSDSADGLGSGFVDGLGAVSGSGSVHGSVSDSGLAAAMASFGDPVASMVVTEGLVRGRELRIGLSDAGAEAVAGLAWRLRVVGASDSEAVVVMPPSSRHELAFKVPVAEGVTEGALVLKNGGAGVPGSFSAEVHVQLYEDLDGPLELELERLTVMDRSGVQGPASSPVMQRLDVVSVQDGDDGSLPREVRLEGNYPNPFNPTTRIRFSLPEAAPVRLEVFDMTGRLVAVPASGMYAAGRHAVLFDGRGLASGVYVYRLHAGGVAQQGKMMLVK